ncbi:uncharacterized protein LOC124889408 isoform X2 [Capsicum annuum]|uniref:uncharacterized protein LOC124889408 isoform X2 n=1 Tax=Capsicum annuum TaxID=4072 RepID=UPI001FB1907A|nr:uncharacterized protein LOC124889408 isoform X2 [Capsicum annuum]
MVIRSNSHCRKQQEKIEDFSTKEKDNQDITSKGTSSHHIHEPEMRTTLPKKLTKDGNENRISARARENRNTNQVYSGGSCWNELSRGLILIINNQNNRLHDASHFLIM